MTKLINLLVAIPVTLIVGFVMVFVLLFSALIGCWAVSVSLVNLLRGR